MRVFGPYDNEPVKQDSSSTSSISTEQIYWLIKADLYN